MIFKELHPETNETLWGCPRYSFHATAWLIDWYCEDGTCEGASVAKGEELEWIKANPDPVDAMVNQCAAWKAKLGQIPY